jgi:hypothetical protein
MSVELVTRTFEDSRPSKRQKLNRTAAHSSLASSSTPNLRETASPCFSRKPISSPISSYVPNGRTSLVAQEVVIVDDDGEEDIGVPVPRQLPPGRRPIERETSRDDLDIIGKDGEHTRAWQQRLKGADKSHEVVDVDQSEEIESFPDDEEQSRASGSRTFSRDQNVTPGRGSIRRGTVDQRKRIFDAPHIDLAHPPKGRITERMKPRNPQV